MTCRSPKGKETINLGTAERDMGSIRERENKRETVRERE